MYDHDDEKFVLKCFSLFSNRHVPVFQPIVYTSPATEKAYKTVVSQSGL